LKLARTFKRVFAQRLAFQNKFRELNSSSPSTLFARALRERAKIRAIAAI